MKLTIVGVKNPGELDTERLAIRVTGDTDVGDYMVAQAAYEGEGQVSSKLKDVLWLPDKEVARGDLVVVYTRSGVDKSRDNERGNRSHFIYWGLKEPIWTDSNVAAVLFYIGEWQPKKIGAGEMAKP